MEAHVAVGVLRRTDLRAPEPIVVEGYVVVGKPDGNRRRRASAAKASHQRVNRDVMI